MKIKKPKNNTKKNVGDMEVANDVFNNSVNTSAAPVSEDYDEDGWHTYKWIVSSIQDSDRDGLQTDNLKDAKSYALEWSKDEPEVEINIYNTRDGSYYLDYLGGKCVRDGWTIKKPKTYRLKGSDGNSYDVKALSKKDAQKALDDYLKKNINESIEKHETLNPKLWGKDEELLPEVREGIQKVVDQFVSELKENEVELKVLDVILVGSNASYNYTKDSDLDVHIVADTSIIPCEYGLLPIIYNMARSQFNNKYDVTIHDVPIEIYVEDMATSANSNGIYSLNSGWIKKPVAVDIPEIDISDVYPEWEERAKKLLNSDDTSVEDVDKFINDVYLLRKTSIMSEGEYGKGNMVFKEIRNNGYLDRLKELKVKLTEKDMIVEDIHDDVAQFVHDNAIYYNEAFIRFVDSYLGGYSKEDLPTTKTEIGVWAKEILDEWTQGDEEYIQDARDYRFLEYIELKIKEKLEDVVDEELLSEVYFVDKEVGEALDTIHQEAQADKFYTHYLKHVVSSADGDARMPNVLPSEYNELANTLSEAPIVKIEFDEDGNLTNTSGTIGYVNNVGTFGKYDIDTELLVIYNNDRAISLYKMPREKFNKKIIRSTERFGFKKDLFEEK